ncbi:hypothetical protein FXO38_11511 [Capsicum annuum]|nr:hypothetical protein FXO38_11511 [Capsicum annuum]
MINPPRPPPSDIDISQATKCPPTRDLNRSLPSQFDQVQQEELGSQFSPIQSLQPKLHITKTILSTKTPLPQNRYVHVKEHSRKEHEGHRVYNDAYMMEGKLRGRRREPQGTLHQERSWDVLWMRLKTRLKMERKSRFKMKMLAEPCVIEPSASSCVLRTILCHLHILWTFLSDFLKVANFMRACCEPKIDRGMTGELRIVPAKRREQGIFRQNRCAMAYDFEGGPRVQACCGLNIDRGETGRLGIIPVWEVGDRPSVGVGHWSWRDHLGGQTGKTAQTGDIRAKTIFYSHSFEGGFVVQGPGMLWAENRSGYAREAGELPIVGRWFGRAICVIERAKRRERDIFVLNWCAIVHGSVGGPGVRACCEPKINWDIPRRMGSGLEWTENEPEDEADDGEDDEESAEDLEDASANAVEDTFTATSEWVAAAGGAGGAAMARAVVGF